MYIFIIAYECLALLLKFGQCSWYVTLLRELKCVCHHLGMCGVVDFILDGPFVMDCLFLGG